MEGAALNNEVQSHGVVVVLSQRAGSQATNQKLVPLRSYGSHVVMAFPKKVTYFHPTFCMCFPYSGSIGSILMEPLADSLLKRKPVTGTVGWPTV